MRVRKGLAVPPVLQEVAKGLLEGDRRLPTGHLLELAGVPEQYGDVRRAHAGGVRLDLHLGLRHTEKKIEHLADRPRASGTDVVYLPRLALLEGEPVRAHDVAHVGEIPARVEIADANHGRAEPLLDIGDLLREIRANEDRAAPWALVVEASCPDHRKLEAHEVLVPEHVLPNLADRVRRERPERICLAYGKLVLIHHAVLLARARELDPRHDMELLHGLENVELADDVRDERFRGGGPRSGHEALGGEVEDPVRTSFLQDVSHRGCVAEIALEHPHLPHKVLDVLGPASPALDPNDLDVLFLAEDVVDEVASGEPSDPRDQSPHDPVLSMERLEVSEASYAATTARGS